MIRSLAFAVLGALSTASFGQFYNWGWGPPITVTESGSSITCSVYDPILEQTRTTSVSSVDLWIHDDGVVATVSASGIVSGTIYDLALGLFRTSQFSSNTGNTISNSDGVIAWVSSAGSVGGAVYDPALQQWNSSQFSSNTGNTVINRDGVISWVSESGTVGGAVYDPALQQWRHSQFSSNSGNQVQNKDGVIAWVSSSGTVGGAIYDMSIGQWNSSQFSSNTGNTLVLGQGVLAWRSESGTIGGAAYDWDSNNWTSSQFSSSSSNTDLVIVDGTVQWSNSGGPQKYGFNASHQWQNGVNTTVQCDYHVVRASGVGAPYVAYLWCMTIGASSYSHQCGDGHLITRRWAWKAYTNPGTYSPELSVFNSISNSGCTGEVHFSGNSVAELDDTGALDVIVRHGSVFVSGPVALGELSLFDAQGRCVHTANTAQASTVLPLPVVDGVYLLRVQGRNRSMDARRIVVVK